MLLSSRKIALLFLLSGRYNIDNTIIQTVLHKQIRYAYSDSGFASTGTGIAENNINIWVPNTVTIHLLLLIELHSIKTGVNIQTLRNILLLTHFSLIRSHIFTLP